MKLYRPSGRRRQVGGRYRKLQHQNATLRAVAAGTSLLGLPLRINSQAEAAKIYGTSPTYVSAAVTVLKAEDPKLVEQVLAGKISLLEAAESVRKTADLVEAYRKASLVDRVAFARVVGPVEIFDEALVPAL